MAVGMVAVLTTMAEIGVSMSSTSSLNIWSYIDSGENGKVHEVNSEML